MKRFLLLCISFIVFLTAPLLKAAEAAEPSDHGRTLPEILILNSYHPGYAWSDDEQAGVIDVFRVKDKNWVPVIEYMDLKRLPDGRHLAELKKLFHLKYQNKKFSVVIAMDNRALEFAIDNHVELFRNAPIVFCGINDYKHSLLKGYPDVTGIAESIDIAETIEVMLRLHPAAREIFIPHDYTVSVLAVRKEIEALVPRFGAKVRFRFTDPLTMEELLEELERLPKNNLVLEIGFITDKSGRTFGMTEAVRLFFEHSPVPVYSPYEQRLGFGIVGGKLLSARMHGAHAARIALRVLAGEKASAIPVIDKSDSHFMFDYKVMSRFGIPLSALPEGSTVINKPVSFYATHRSIIQTAVGVIVFMAIVISLLVINIIQRRRSSEVIRRSEEMFKVITSSTPDHLIVQDKDLRYSFVMNPQMGLTQQDMIGKTDHDFLSKEDADKLTEIKREVLNTGNPVHLEVPLTSSAGEQQFFDGSYIPKFDARNQVDGLIGYFKNITERRQAEEALRRAEENFRRSLDDSPLGVRIVTIEGETIYANRAVLDLFSIEELNTTPLIKRYTPESYAELQIRREIRKRGDYSPSEYNISMVRKDGEVHHLNVFRKEILWNGERQFQVIYQDVTKRKRAEEEKRRMEERSRKIVEDIFRFIPEGVLVFSRKMELLRQNQAFRELVSGYVKRLGFAEDELENLIVDKIKAAMGDKNIKEIRISRKHETGEQTFDEIEELVLELDMARILFAEEEEEARIIVSIKDITERIRAEMEIKALARFPSENPGPILRIARDGTLLYVNEASLSQLPGVALQVGRGVPSIMRDVVSEAMKSGKTRLLDLEDRGRIYSFFVAPIADASYANLYGRDITERKLAEQELRASREQMRALAGRQQEVREEERTQIAREIHDELGGALTGMKVDVSFLIKSALKIENEAARASLLAGMDSVTKNIDTTIHAVRRIAMELRPGILDDLGLVAALEWQLKDFEKRTGIRCEFFPPAEDISLDADLSTALFRIFQEALTNVARHSGATEVCVRLRVDADSTTLEVEDNGKGIGKKKALSLKSLGLLGMRERAQIFGGRVTVTGTPGIGTTVAVEISPVEKRQRDRGQEGDAG